MAKGNRKKNLLLLTLTICMMTGCNGGPAAKDGLESGSNKTEDAEEYVYVPRVYEYSYDNSAGIQWIHSVAVAGEDILVFGTGYANDGKPCSQVMAVNIDTGERRDYDIGLSENRYINSVTAAECGYIVYSEEFMPEVKYGIAELESAHLTYYDEDFNFESETEITDFIIGINGSSTLYCDYMTADRDGNVYFCYNGAIHVVSRDGKRMARIDLPDGCGQGMVFAGERLILAYEDKRDNAMVVSVDIQNETLGEPFKNMPDCGNNINIFAGSDVVFYLASEYGLYSCHGDSSECEEVVKWLECDLNGLGQICTAEDGKIISIQNNGDMYELILLEKLRRADVKEKTALTVAMIKNDPLTIEQLMRFNRTSRDYRLEIKIYAENESPEALEAAITQFNMDLISGNVGDIVFVTGDLDFTNLASKGAFAALDDFLKQDAELDKSDFIDNIVDTLSVDGKLYGIAPYFYLNTLVGKTANVGTGDSWNVSDVKNMMEKHEDSVLMYGMQKEDALGMFLRYNMGSYYNSQTGECCFDGESFKKVLEMASTFPGELDLDEVNANWDNMSAYANDVRLLDNYSSYYGFYGLQHYRVIFGDEVNLIGYPVDTGSGTSVSFGNGLYAISSASGKKEAAWQFIRQYLSEEYQTGTYDMKSGGMTKGFPIRKDVFEQLIETAMAEAPDTVWMHGGIKFELEPLSEADAEYFRRLIYGVTRNSYIDYKMYKIIMEEADAYFSGQRTVDDVASVIQNRVQLYVDENK